MEEYFYVIYRNGYGYYNKDLFPSHVWDKYFKYKKDTITCDNCIRIGGFCYWCKKELKKDIPTRSDKKLIDICKKYYDDCRHLSIEGKFNPFYKNYVKINKDKDKIEEVVIDVPGYVMDTIKGIKNDETEENIKKTILQLQEIIKEPKIHYNNIYRDINLNRYKHSRDNSFSSISSDSNDSNDSSE